MEIQETSEEIKQNNLQNTDAIIPEILDENNNVISAKSEESETIGSLADAVSKSEALTQMIQRMAMNRHGLTRAKHSGKYTKPQRDIKKERKAERQARKINQRQRKGK